MHEKHRRILLIEPPFSRLFKNTYSLDRHPLALGYLAGTIKQELNWDVMNYNADFNPKSEIAKVSYIAGLGYERYLRNLKDLSAGIWSEVRQTISEYRPSVVGISAKSQNFTSACIVARLAKEIDSKIIVIVGGPHASMVGKDVLACDHVDIGVMGEGERTIVELLETIESGTCFEGVKGVVYRDNGAVRQNPPRDLIEDLDSLCFPHESAPLVLKDYEKYPLMAFRSVFAIRGCPYNCFFCGSRKIWTRRVRFRTPQNVIREIKLLRYRGIRSIRFDDDTFGVNKQHIKDLCDAIRTDCPGTKWSCEMHIKLIDDEIISLMKRSGCHSIVIGIESGNNEILKAMRKNITIEEALNACEIINRYGIELGVFFMVGFPQETESTLSDTLAAMTKVKCDTLVYNIFTPYPGTETFEFCKEHDLIGNDFDVSLYNHHSPANCFCMNIPPDRFRVIVSKVERTVDRKQFINRIKRIFSANIFWRMQELGLLGSLKKAIRVFVGR